MSVDEDGVDEMVKECVWSGLENSRLQPGEKQIHTQLYTYNTHTHRYSGSVSCLFLEVSVK